MAAELTREEIVEHKIIDKAKSACDDAILQVEGQMEDLQSDDQKEVFKQIVSSISQVRTQLCERLDEIESSTR